MKKGLRLFLVLLVAGTTAVLLLHLLLSGGDLPSYPVSADYLADEKGTFFSVRELGLPGMEAIAEVRRTHLPVVGRINTFLSSLEYLYGHDLTADDLDQVLGRDFSLQVSPHFLFVARTRKEYQVFHHFRVREDTVHELKGMELMEKKVRPLNRSLFYVFSSGYLFASDRMDVLKAFLLRKMRTGRRKVFPPALWEEASARTVMAGVSDRHSVLRGFFPGFPFLISGDRLDSMVFRAVNELPAVPVDSRLFLGFHYDFARLLERRGPMQGGVYVEITRDGNEIVPGFTFYVPARIKPEDRETLKARLISAYGIERPLHSLERDDKAFLLSTGFSHLDLQENGQVFIFDASGLAAMDVYHGAFNRILERTGKVSVRRDTAQ